LDFWPIRQASAPVIESNEAVVTDHFRRTILRVVDNHSAHSRNGLWLKFDRCQFIHRSALSGVETFGKSGASQSPRQHTSVPMTVAW
jgi:hypothetical protein